MLGWCFAWSYRCVLLRFMAQHACQHGATRRPRARSSRGLVGSDVLVVNGGRHFLLTRCRVCCVVGALLSAPAHGTVGEEGDACRSNSEDRNHQVLGIVVGRLWALLCLASGLLSSEVSGLGRVERVEILLLFCFRVVVVLDYVVEQEPTVLVDRQFVGLDVEN